MTDGGIAREQRLLQAFDRVLDVPRAERLGYIRQHYAVDTTFMRDLERLAAADADDGPLAHPVESLAHPVLDDLQERIASAQSELPAELRAALAPRYALEEPIGSGGMASVYLAFDTTLEKHVAVKVLRPELADGLTLGRFQREIALMVRLDHPHVVSVYDRDPGGSLLYYVMRYVPGGSLRDLLTTRRRLPVPEALAIVRDVADALDYAHAQSVIHRDIKPENILLDEHGAYVADFGVARLLDAAGRENLTRTGAAIGTVMYMSPEQADGALPIDGRSDVYSLACVLYEMLAGEPPYAGSSRLEILTKHMVGEIPDLCARCTSVTPPMQAVIAAGLAKSRDERVGGARELVDRFEKAFRDASAVSLPAQPGYTVAVLPFANMSGDSSKDYFSDGITEELIGALIRVGGIRAVARTSCFVYRGQHRDVREIAKELGATHVVEGAVRMIGQRLRASVQLVDGSSGKTLWAERYDRDLEDVLKVQDEITKKIVVRLRHHLKAPAAPGRGGLSSPRAEAAASLTSLKDATRDLYEILDNGGDASMTQYVAADRKHGRSVAIRLIGLRGREEGESQEQLRRAIRVPVSLQHPNILPVFEVIHVRERIYVVSPIVAGGSLRSLLQERSQLTLKLVFGIAQNVGSALAYAHEHGCVHGDLRPERILIDSSTGLAVVMDFAIGALLEASLRSGEPGIFLGAPHYMAPEAFLRKEFSPASDQYSFAVIIYELLAGRPPFPGKNFSEVITGTAFERIPDVRALRPDVNEPVALALQRMMAKEPGERFPDCLAALRALGMTLGPPSGPPVAVMARYSAEDAEMGDSGRPGTFGASGASRASLSLVARVAAFMRRLFRPKKLERKRVQQPQPERVPQPETEELRSIVMGLPPATGDEYMMVTQQRIVRRFPAYDAYLRGRFLLRFESRVESLEKAIHEFDVAIRGNASFAPAYASRAYARTLLARAQGRPSTREQKATMADVDRALHLAPALAEAHVANALHAIFFEWDAETALSALDYAIETTPAHAEAHLWRGFHLLWLEGKPAEARAALNRALELDPLSVATHVELAFAYALAGELAQALRDADRAVELGAELNRVPSTGETTEGRPSGFASAYYARAVILAELNRLDEALADANEACRVGGKQVMHLAQLGFIYGRRGDIVNAQAVIAELRNRDAHSTATAMVHAGSNASERMFDSLYAALNAREPDLILVPFSPQFARVRNEPLFMALIEKIRDGEVRHADAEH